MPSGFCIFAAPKYKYYDRMSASAVPQTRSKRILFSLIALLFGLAIVFLLCELVFRLFPQLTTDPPAQPPHNYRVPQETAGWVVKEGYQYDGELRDFKGNPYPLHITFGENGFRKWGDPNSSKKKVLFIGDSYTACAQTSDDKLFYKILGDSMPIEVFAYGAAGFSNAQEYIIAEYYIKEIKPDIVVWQLCSNDFLDNYWELEKIARYHVRMRRPYILEDGSITYQLAAEWPRTVKPYSRFLYYLLKRIGEVRGTFDKGPAEPAEKLIAEQNLAFEPFKRSCDMTGAIFRKMNALMPLKTKLLVFDADSFNPQYEQFARLCQENNLTFIPGLDQYVRQAEAKGEVTRSDDGYHWNNRGNELVAAFLKKELEKELSGQ